MNIVLSICLISIINSCNTINTPLLDLVGKIYSTEEKSDDPFPFYSKSTIEFSNDEILIIHFPFDPAGNLSYQIGTYTLAHNSDTIHYEINKSISFSLNVGMVISYSKNCHKEQLLIISKNGQVTKQNSIPENQKKWKMINPLPEEFNYKLDTNSSSSFGGCYYNRFINFEDERKLRDCF